MATRTGSIAVVGLLLAAGAFVVTRQEEPAPQRQRTPRERYVVLVATWQPNRNVRIAWSAAGERHTEEHRISPWERRVAVKAGSVVTITLAPGGAPDAVNTCTIEDPPGRPVPGRGQATGSGNTVLFCEHTVGS